jgi:phosphomannomutase
MNILLFDVDGTLCESGKKINSSIAKLLNKFISINCIIGIVGGGTYTNINYQLNGLVKPHMIFSECGSVYHKLNKQTNKNDLIYINNLRLEPEYLKINILVKICLKYISQMNYLVSGNFIDLRNGLIYISLVGMVSTDEERNEFIRLEKIHNYRNELIELLKSQAKELKIYDKIDICLGGSVGIAIYPTKWNKVQVLKWINYKKTDNIYYFGDKYLKDGNDYEIINHPFIKGNPIDTIEETYNKLNILYEKIINKQKIEIINI